MEIFSVTFRYCYVLLAYIFTVACTDIQATVGLSKLGVPGRNNFLFKDFNERLGNFEKFTRERSYKYLNKTLAAKLRKPDAKPFVISIDRIFLSRELIECIYATNYLRSLHGLDELLWDADLAYRAEDWAMVLAARNNGWAHSQNPDNHDLYFGENIYVGRLQVRSCVDAIYSWYSEIKDYDFDNPEQSSVTGHFLQIVWPTTRYMGMGIAFTEDDDTYIVAQYMDGASEYPVPIAPFSEETGKDDLYMDPKPPEKTISYRVPLDGGWTSWESVTHCSVTCGKGVRLHRRYYIDPEAASNKVPINRGNEEKEKVVECGQKDCPLKLVGECNDLSNDCGESGKSNCMDTAHWEAMKKNCKKTCNFCRSCTDIKVDCAAYATPPYNFCTDVRYRDWMLVDCAKSCGYCEENVTTVYDTECINYHPDCDSYAKKWRFCMDEKYGPWMSVYCKHSCGFCKECEKTYQYCEYLASTYGYCTHKKYKTWMDIRCSKTCNYCFESPKSQRVQNLAPKRTKT